MTTGCRTSASASPTSCREPRRASTRWRRPSTSAGRLRLRRKVLRYKPDDCCHGRRHRVPGDVSRAERTSSRSGHNVNGSATPRCSCYPIPAGGTRTLRMRKCWRRFAPCGGGAIARGSRSDRRHGARCPRSRRRVTGAGQVAASIFKLVALKSRHYRLRSRIAHRRWLSMRPWISTWWLRCFFSSDPSMPSISYIAPSGKTRHRTAQGQLLHW